jgi:signal transduction histidine kinase
MAQSRRPSSKNKPKNKPKKTAKSDIEQIAALYVQARSALVRAGRALHDHVGSSLSAAGVQLQLLRMDVPQAEARIDEALRTLEEALNQVRNLSRELCPSPAYRGGLKQALLRLADQNGSQHGSTSCHVVVDYFSTAKVPAEIAAALYEAGSAAVEQALRQGAARVTITARGAGQVVLRIADDGGKSGRARALSVIGTLAREQGLGFECTTGKGTIVSIRYATRRPTRG